MPHAEIYLSAFISVICEKLASGELLDEAGVEGIDSQLKKWSKMLLKIQAVLSDAEERQITEEAVWLWLDDVQGLAYDLDDILDDLATVALRRKLMAGPQASTSKLQSLLIPTCCTTFNRSDIAGDFMVNYNMRSKLEAITARLQALVKTKHDLDLREAVRRRERLHTTTSLVADPLVYGRETDKEAVLELLLSDETCGDEVCVIPIFGMGGIGKTTLAQLVYADERVKESFDIRAWVCVSDEFDEFMITKSILESVTFGIANFNKSELEMLQSTLMAELSGKKYLLVLDDVWNEDYRKWDLLRRPFRVGSPGSKIIVTTRSSRVALVMGSVQPYPLKQLADDDCLSILAQCALGRRDFEAHPKFKEIGEALVRKCGGLPLAVKALGGLLRTKASRQEWEAVLNNIVWDLPRDEVDIHPVLRLTYDHLPSHLKQLFAYCSIVPKDYEFEKYELVLLWMGEGFLGQSRWEKQMEELGVEYFNELLLRSFFQSSSGDRFVMHDLVSDLAQSVAGEICFRLDDETKSNEQYVLSEKARHSSFIRCKYDGFQKFKDFSRPRGLRTFLPFPIYKPFDWQPFFLTNKVLHDLLPELRCLRVLSLSGYSISELPDSIGDLLHLRYLNLSATLITQLPEALTRLCHLQTLLLRSCSRLTTLPTSIGKLINLRHIDIAGADQLQEMPLGMGKLTSLQTLSKFVVGKSNGLRVMELRDLSNLQGALSIVGLHKVTDIEDANEANLSCKQNLHELVMEWSSNFDDPRDVRLENGVLEMVRPHGNLRKLKIAFYGGTIFPSWIRDPSLSNLEHLTLSGCKKCTSLPSLGQLPSLKMLTVQDMDGVKSVGVELFGAGYPQNVAFRSLETLLFQNMLGWEEWSTLTDFKENVGRAFPGLRELSMCRCPNLTKVSLPPFPSLRVLNIRGCCEVVLSSMVGLASVAMLNISEIAGLSQLREGVLQFLVALEDLDISGCGELTSLWQAEAAQQHLVKLRDLHVYDCLQLVSLAEREQVLPQNLVRLVVRGCDNLEKLSDRMNNMTSLRELSIRQCDRLVSFAGTGLPPMLRRLEIRHCKALELPPINNNRMMMVKSNSSNMYPFENDGEDNNDDKSFSHLERLLIQGCPSLRSFPIGWKLPNTLKELLVFDCLNLETDLGKILQLNSLSSLELLHIHYWANLKSLPECLLGFVHLTVLIMQSCPGLQSIPESVFPPSLRRLAIGYCENLKSLPNDHMQSLLSLEDLQIYVCPSLKSFPQGLWPPNLRSLHIGDLNQPISKWERLPTYLYDLTITGKFPELVSFADVVGLLPNSLTSLHIWKPVNLESLSKGLQDLTSLEVLSVYYCPKLGSLPDSLLPTLSSLKIRGCPLLEQRCLKEKGDYWPLIANIPCLEIEDGVFGLSI